MRRPSLTPKDEYNILNKVLEYLASIPRWVPLSELQRYEFCSNADLKRILNGLEDVKLIVKQGHGYNDPYRYRLAAAVTDKEEQTNNPGEILIVTERQRWETLFQEQLINDDIAIVPVADIARLIGILPKEGMTGRTKPLGLKSCEEIAHAAEKAGFGIEPDPRITYRTYEYGAVVGLFRYSSDSPFPEDDDFSVAALLFEISASVELDIIDKILKHALWISLYLSELDSLRLNVLHEVLKKYPISRKQLSIQFARSFSEKQRWVIFFTFTEIRHTDKVDIVDVNILDFLRLNLDKLTRDNYLQILTICKEYDLRFMTYDSLQSTCDDWYQTQSIDHTDDKFVETSADVIDTERLSRLMESTSKAHELLAQEFSEMEDNSESTVLIPEEITSPEIILKYLPERYHRFLHELIYISHPSCSFAVLARQHGLMPGGVFEALNDWADEYFGDVLLDNDQDFTFNANIVEQIRCLLENQQ